MTNLFQIADCLFVRNFCRFVDYIWLLLENATYDESTVSVGNFSNAAEFTFYLRQDYKQVDFYKNRVFLSLIGPSETGESQLFHNWLKNGTFQPKFDKISFFHQHSRPLYDVMQQKIEGLEFVQGVIFEFIDSLKTNSTKYLLTFEDYCEEVCNSKAFVEIAPPGRHRGLRTIYNMHNLVHRSKLGRDLELWNTHIVLFKSPREVMQVSTLSAQLGFGSELVESNLDITSVPYGHFWLI